MVTNILSGIFNLLENLVALIPDMSDVTTGFGNLDMFIAALGYGFIVFPLPLFLFFIANVVFWLGLQFVWAIIEWIYKKIPGVN